MKKAIECFDELPSRHCRELKVLFYQTILSNCETSRKEGKELNMNKRKYAFMMKIFIKLAVHIESLQRCSKPKKIKNNTKM